jgi:hypothetical protein
MKTQGDHRLMNGRCARSYLGALMVSAALAGPAVAQQASTEELKRSIDSLRDGIGVLQSEIQDIKSILAGQLPPPSGVNVLIDIASNPVKGEREARLTLIEVSDYQ